MMKSLLRWACEAAEMIRRGSLSSFLNPRGEVGYRVFEVNGVQNSSLIRQECRSQFGNQFFHRIAIRAEFRRAG